MELTVDILIRHVADLGRHNIKGERLSDSDPGFLQAKAVAFFETAGLNLKALWYHRSRVEALDAEYSGLVQVPTDPGWATACGTRAFPMTDGSYYPFFEAMEFAALLNAARATVEAFCQGAGMPFKNAQNSPPAGLAALLNVQAQGQKLEPRAAQLSAGAEDARLALAGLPEHQRRRSPQS